MTRPVEVLVASEVLGWEVCDTPNCGGCDCRVTLTGGGSWMYHGDRIAMRLSEYLEGWPGISLVVEAMRDNGWRLTLREYAPPTRIDRRWKVAFYTENDVRVKYAATLPSAVFLAALRAVGVDEEEIQAALRVSEGDDDAR